MRFFSLFCWSLEKSYYLCKEFKHKGRENEKDYVFDVAGSNAADGMRQQRTTQRD
jgi:hypothetical protein